MGQPADTSAEARERQLQAYRAMTRQDRLHLAADMSAEIRSLARSGIRARHPEYAFDEVEAALAAIILGPELAAIAKPPPRAGRR
jgi:hypothetical protein